MGNFSDKVKIVYLLIVIVIMLGVFVYLLNNWGIIQLTEYVPGLEDEAPIVSEEVDDPFVLRERELEKERERLEDLEIQLQEKERELEEREVALEQSQAELEQREQSVEEALASVQDREEQLEARETLVANMAERIRNMPPQEAVALMDGMSNQDVVAVFRRMERDAAAGGQQSIVPYLMQLMPDDRAALIATQMMDAQVDRLP